MKQVTSSIAVRTLKIDTCPSLSGKSTLTFHLGCTAEADIVVRIYANSGGGFHSQFWIALDSIREVLSSASAENPVTAALLGGLFVGRSVNTAGFLLAALLHLGLVQALPDKREYESIDPAGFLAEMETLMAAPADMNADSQTAPTNAAKKPAGKGKPKT